MLSHRWENEAGLSENMVPQDLLVDDHLPEKTMDGGVIHFQTQASPDVTRFSSNLLNFLAPWHRQRQAFSLCKGQGGRGRSLWRS